MALILNLNFRCSPKFKTFLLTSIFIVIYILLTSSIFGLAYASEKTVNDLHGQKDQKNIFESVDEILNLLSKQNGEEANPDDLINEIEREAIVDYLAQVISDLKPSEHNIFLSEIAEVYLGFHDKRFLIRKLFKSVYDKISSNLDGQKTNQFVSLIDDTFYYGFLILFGRRVSRFIYLHLPVQFKSRIYKSSQNQLKKIGLDFDTFGDLNLKKPISSSFALGFLAGAGHSAQKNFEDKKVNPLIFLELLEYELACQLSLKSVDLVLLADRERQLMQNEAQDLMAFNVNLKYERFDDLINFITHTDKSAFLLFSSLSSYQPNLCSEVSLARVLDQMREFKK